MASPIGLMVDDGSSLLGFIFRILKGNPKKELLWSLWEERSEQVLDSVFRAFTGSGPCLQSTAEQTM